jgi:hypothetical protein
LSELGHQLRAGTGVPDTRGHASRWRRAPTSSDRTGHEKSSTALYQRSRAFTRSAICALTFWPGPGRAGASPPGTASGPATGPPLVGRDWLTTVNVRSAVVCVCWRADMALVALLTEVRLCLGRWLHQSHDRTNAAPLRSPALLPHAALAPILDQSLTRQGCVVRESGAAVLARGLIQGDPPGPA